MLDHARVVLATARGALVLATYRRPSSALTFAEIRERARRWAAVADEAERAEWERERIELEAAKRQGLRDGAALAAVAEWVPEVERELLACAEAMEARSPTVSYELLGLKAASDRLEGALARVTKYGAAGVR